MAWAEIINGKITIGCSTVENHLATQLPGCNFDKDKNTWHAPLSWATVVTLHMLWHGQQLDRGPELQAWSKEAYEDVLYSWKLRGALDDRAADESNEDVMAVLDGLDELSVPFEDGRPRRLYPFQRGGAAYLADRRRGILGDEQGQGKTAQLIRAMQLVRALGSVGSGPFPALVVCTVAAVRNWEREIANWAPELRTVVVDGTALRRRQAIERDDADVWIMGWPNVRAHTRLEAYPGVRFVRCKACGGIDDGIAPARCEVHAKDLNLRGVPWRTVIADEAHRMQDARSKQTRALWWLLHQAEYRWLATGTPIGDHIGELWPLLHGLDIATAPSRSRYLDLFAIKEHNFHGGSTVLGIRPDTAETFHSFVQPLIRRIPRAIALPFLPKRMEPVFRYPEMTPAQKRTYDKIKKSAMAELEGRLVVAQNDLVSFSRLCQLASSMLEVVEGEDADGFTTENPRMVAPSSKVADLVDFLEDEDGQLVVASNSPQLVALAEKALAAKKITHCKIVGGMNADAMDQAVTWFQRGDCRVIFITAAGAESITLTAAHTIYFMQPDPSWRSREQKISRIDRIGQEGHPQGGIRIVYSITPKSVEERLYQLGQEKGERAAQVTRDADMLRWLIGGESGG
jgi:SNF2 family DNA or RNA helicase